MILRSDIGRKGGAMPDVRLVWQVGERDDAVGRVGTLESGTRTGKTQAREHNGRLVDIGLCIDFHLRLCLSHQQLVVQALRIGARNHVRESHRVHVSELWCLLLANWRVAWAALGRVLPRHGMVVRGQAGVIKFAVIDAARNDEVLARSVKKIKQPT